MGQGPGVGGFSQSQCRDLEQVPRSTNWTCAHAVVAVLVVAVLVVLVAIAFILLLLSSRLLLLLLLLLELTHVAAAVVAAAGVAIGVVADAADAVVSLNPIGSIGTQTSTKLLMRICASPQLLRCVRYSASTHSSVLASPRSLQILVDTQPLEYSTR